MNKKTNHFYSFLVRFLGVLFKVFYRFSVSGKENIPKYGSVVLVANHTSYFDPIVLGIAVFPRQVHFMAKEELFEGRILGPIIKKLGTFPVRRGKYDRQTLKNSLRVLSKGEALALFPEGKRYRLADGKLGPLRKGAAFIAIKSGALVVPIGIKGTEKIFSEGSSIPQFPKIKVKIGKPLPSINNKEKLMEKVGKDISLILGEM